MFNAFEPHRWARISMLNLLVVAILGVVMRYKIGFEFPLFDQKYLQHAHSHFAFAGWVSQTLMLAMISLLTPAQKEGIPKIYSALLALNLLTAWGMLLSFAAQGYGPVSISFSTASILLTFAFSIRYYRDLKRCQHILQKEWFMAGILFNLLSTLGTLALVYMMATKHIPQHSYLASVYWYLHFQYNGWFFFVIAGLFVHHLQHHLQISFPKKICWLFAASCIPAYGLSILWLQLHWLIYLLVVAASLAQLWAWKLLIQTCVKSKAALSIMAKAPLLLIIYAAAALSIKLLLQAASVVPQISKLAFGFRPVVIAYLHLVLLAATTVFLLGYILLQGWMPDRKWVRHGIVIFVAGIFLNELALGIQGIASFSYTVVPHINLALLGIAVIMAIGLLIILSNSLKTGPGNGPQYD